MEKEFSSTVKIRFADCDPIGHLNNVKYLEYMLNAREDHVEQNYWIYFMSNILKKLDALGLRSKMKLLI